MGKFKISEAHWSQIKKDSHNINDSDSTYAVLDHENHLIAIFARKEDAENYIKQLYLE